MTDKIFIDTNILIYAADNHYPEKQNRARELLRIVANERRGVLSTQVLQEFYAAATKKLRINPLLAKEIMRGFERMEIITVTIEMIREAIDVNILNRISFWDSLIVVSAEYSNCYELWTEDLNDGQTIRGVKIKNPFL